MDPVTILLWIAVVFSVIIGTLLVFVLIRLLRILTALDRILTYVDHVRDLMQMWETWPIEIGKRILGFVIDWFAK
jgi:hypothetical protein